MLVAYLKIDVDAGHHQRLDVLAELLKTDRRIAFFHLVAFWSGVMKHRPNGNVDDLPDATIETWSEWPSPRKKGKTPFSDALRSSGAIRDNGDVSGWGERYGKIVTANAGRSEKMKGNRNAQRENRRDTDVCTDRQQTSVQTEDRRETDVYPKSVDIALAQDQRPKTKDKDPLKPPTGGHVLFDRWNELARSTGMAAADSFTPDRKRAAERAIAAGLLDAWADFEAALRSRSGEWHRAQRLGFDWLCRAKAPWRDLVERWKAQGGASTAPLNDGLEELSDPGMRELFDRAAAEREARKSARPPTP